MQRFYVPQFVHTHTTELVISKQSQPELWHQLKNVLRAAIGMECIFFFGTNEEFQYRLLAIESGDFCFEMIQQLHNNTELDFSLTLIQALPQKTEKWEWILQKCTELGVSSFVPLISERTQRHSLPKMERMTKILIEATEQSGRTTIPTILAIEKLPDLQFDSKETVLFASFNAQTSLQQLVTNLTALTSLTLIIGPEGGFSEFEEELLLKKGAIPYSLGKRVLRLETAAIASATIASTLSS